MRDLPTSPGELAEKSAGTCFHADYSSVEILPFLETGSPIAQAGFELTIFCFSRLCNRHFVCEVDRGQAKRDRASKPWFVMRKEKWDLETLTA